MYLILVNAEVIAGIICKILLVQHSLLNLRILEELGESIFHHFGRCWKNTCVIYSICWEIF